MQQAFKTLMGQMDSQNNLLNNASVSPGFPFPFPTPTVSGQSTSPSPVASSQAAVYIPPVTKVETPPTMEVKDDKELNPEPKKSGKE